MKLIGTYNGIPFYEDPNCPPNTMYMMNDHYLRFTTVKPSLWQKIKAWILKKR